MMRTLTYAGSSSKRAQYRLVNGREVRVGVFETSDLLGPPYALAHGKSISFGV
jgi:hypothetical protein